ncbi:MAG: hypothetical protein DRQ55_16285 [Planctomycetota bacterium]|nr:MAG: hypothetical protein DRQ55_16285 [Planctomycetota bacterium]
MKPAADLPRQPDDPRPRLLVLIDVEEEFDWNAPFDRSQRGASHVPALADCVGELALRGLRPVGVITHPVLDDPDAVATLRELVNQGSLLAGAHLHPWVTPPFDEVVNGRNSFPGNLPAALEGAKLNTLTERITEVLGTAPRVYQAGRYGVGPATIGLLAQAGYLVDMSLAPPFDYRPEGGPDFTRIGPVPRWSQTSTPILSIPTTGALLGRSSTLTGPMYRAATSSLLRPTRLPGLLARAGLAERLRLSPEGYTLAEMQRLSSALVNRGCRVLTVSFHSPSLVPGYTSYVRNEDDRAAFMQRLLGFCDWFFDTLGGVPSDALALRDELLAPPPPSPST